MADVDPAPPTPLQQHLSQMQRDLPQRAAVINAAVAWVLEQASRGTFDVFVRDMANSARFDTLSPEAAAVARQILTSVMVACRARGLGPVPAIPVTDACHQLADETAFIISPGGLTSPIDRILVLRNLGVPINVPTLPITRAVQWVRIAAAQPAPTAGGQVWI